MNVVAYTPKAAPTMPSAEILQVVLSGETKPFLRWIYIEKTAIGIEKIRFIPCDSSWGVVVNSTRYKIKTEPPPRPIEEITPAKKPIIS